MKSLLKDIEVSASKNKKMLAVLIDPDKIDLKQLNLFITNIHKTTASHIFIGGSTVNKNDTQQLVKALKPLTNLPLILFPGDITQISKDADAILYLSLISGKNTEYLIGKHVESVPILNNTKLEVIPTGYILIDGGNKTMVQKVTQTMPLTQPQEIANTAKAGEYLGLKLIYLEAGSGALNPVDIEVIKKTKKTLNIPLIVGGGIRSKKQLNDAYSYGADIVVIGTAFEKDPLFFNQLLK